MLGLIFGLMLIGDHGHHHYEQPTYHLGTPQEERTERHLENIERELRYERKNEEHQREEEQNQEREEEQEHDGDTRGE